MSHVSQPRFLVMSLLGKKYPKTQEEFDMTFHLDKLTDPKLVFEAEKAGKRMYVPIPVTWERELSKGQGP